MSGQRFRVVETRGYRTASEGKTGRAEQIGFAVLDTGHLCTNIGEWGSDDHAKGLIRGRRGGSNLLGAERARERAEERARELNEWDAALT